MSKIQLCFDQCLNIVALSLVLQSIEQKKINNNNFHESRIDVSGFAFSLCIRIMMTVLNGTRMLGGSICYSLFNEYFQDEKQIS